MFIDRNYHLHLTLWIRSLLAEREQDKALLHCGGKRQPPSCVCLSEKRIAVARVLLITTDLRPPWRNGWGISDYNYFTKVFRSIQGSTPSRYRQNREMNRQNRSGACAPS